MAIDHRLGALYWVDHYAVTTNDLDRWVDWNAEVLGATEPWHGIAAPRGSDRRAEFRWLCGAHVIGFAHKAPLAPLGKELGQAAPRWGFFVRGSEMDEHLRRLDRLKVPHTDPVRTSQEGEEGVVVYFKDGDDNQFEFWAPDRLPEGAIDESNPLHVGRISHGVLESRDLDRTAAFYGEYCGLDPVSNADIPSDTLVFPLEAGGRLIFKKVDKLSLRTGGSGVYQGVHHAFIVRDEEYLAAYRKLWAELPEWERRQDGSFDGDSADLPARTGLHGSDAGRRFKAMWGRGDQIVDGDTNAFHFVGGKVKSSPNLATYEACYMEDYLETLMKEKEKEGSAPA